MTDTDIIEKPPTTHVQMGLTALGVGSAFALKNWQSNFLVEVRQQDTKVRRLLIDCGGDVRHSLNAIGLTLVDIDAVYISHLHADHIGGLEGVAFTTYFNPTLPRPVLFGHSEVLVPLWQTSLCGGLGSIGSEDLPEGQDVAALETYFDVRPVTTSFSFAGIEFELVQTIHCYSGTELWPSYGLAWTAPNGTRVFVTTDSQYNPAQLGLHYSRADVILQDCETSKFASGVHAHYDQLAQLVPEIKSKMHLYHYQDGFKADCIADGFAGWLENGDAFIWRQTTDG